MTQESPLYPPGSLWKKSYAGVADFVWSIALSMPLMAKGGRIPLPVLPMVAAAPVSLSAQWERYNPARREG